VTKDLSFPTTLGQETSHLKAFPGYADCKEKEETDEGDACLHALLGPIYAIAAKT